MKNNESKAVKSDDLPATQGMFKEFDLKWEHKFNSLDQKIDAVSEDLKSKTFKFQSMEKKIEANTCRIESLDRKIDSVESRLTGKLEEMHKDIREMKFSIQQQESRNLFALDGFNLISHENQEIRRELREKNKEWKSFIERVIEFREKEYKKEKGWSTALLKTKLCKIKFYLSHFSKAL